MVFVAHLSFVISNTLLTHYARWVEVLDGSVRDVGLVLGTAAIVAMLSRPFAGTYIDRLGARNTWLLGLVLFLVGLLAGIWIVQLNVWVYICRIMMLIGQGLVFTSGLTYVSQVAPRHRQTEAFAVFGSAGFVAMFLGPNLGDIILGTGPWTSANFAILFGVAGALLIVSAFCLLLVRVPPVSQSKAPAGITGFISTVRRYWPGAVLVCTLTFSMVCTIPFGFLPSYVDAVGLNGKALSGVGLFFLAYGGWGLVVRLSTRRVADQIGRRKVLISGLLLTSLGMFSFLLVNPQHAWTIFLPGLICGSGHALVFPAINALTMGCFPDKSKGTGSMLSLTVCDFGVVAAAPLFGFVADEIGYDALFALAGTMAFGAAAFYFCVSVPIWRERRLGISART